MNAISKYLIEKNYEKKVKEMYLVCLHPDNKNNNYLRTKVVDLTEEINELLDEKRNS